MDFNTDAPQFEADLKEVLRLFDADLSGEYAVTHRMFRDGTEIVNAVTIDGRETIRKDNLISTDTLLEKRFKKRFAKLALYDALAAYWKKEMPWGALTGIRPTRLYAQLCAEIGESNVADYFQNVLHVSAEKTELVQTIVAEQAPIVNTDPTVVDVYVGIPFCTSRCAYCSFLSSEIGAVKDSVEPYAEALLKEIAALKQLIREASLTVRAVYVGGGTPTALSAGLLSRILNACEFSQREFTCEAGRPDTVTTDKLDAMKAAGVTRISINPQTFHDKTLQIIGRRHTAEDTLRCYETAAAYPFSINMDLIAGLPEENVQDFLTSLRQTIALRPQAITVHTLALKSGARLKLEKYHVAEGVSDMVDGAFEHLISEGYRPYYMYRQKYMASNLENVGYTLPGEACLYNVDIMEENTSILAAGANAITKRVYPGGGHIERQADSKDVRTYLQNIDALIAKKRNLFFPE